MSKDKKKKNTKKKQKWFRIILYNILIVFLILTLLEVTIAYFLNHPDKSPKWLTNSLKAYYEHSDRKTIQFSPDCAHYSEDLFYELNSGEFQFSNREFDNSFVVNSKGFRDDEKSLDFPEIIALGDSYTMGWGVNQNETFASLIEQRLRIKVLNTGVSSYGTVREVFSLKKVKMDSVRYVILQYCPNDFNENKQFMIAEDSLVVSPKVTWDKTVTDHLRNTEYFLFKHILKIIPTFQEPTLTPSNQYIPINEIEKLSQDKVFLNVLKKTNLLPSNIRLIIFSLEAEKCDNSFIKSVQKLLEKEHGSSLHDRISFLDLSDEITSKERFILDPHLNKKGHDVIAEKIIKHIKQLELKGGKQSWYYENGTLGYTCNYKNGLKHGVFMSYWENGKISRVGYYLDGQKQGEEINYSQSGWPYERKYFIDDKLKGKHLTYDSLGKIIDIKHH